MRPTKPSPVITIASMPMPMIEVDTETYMDKCDQYEQLGMSTDHLMAVDLNHGFVPMDVDGDSKNSNDDLDLAARNIQSRFGLDD